MKGLSCRKSVVGSKGSKVPKKKRDILSTRERAFLAISGGDALSQSAHVSIALIDKTEEALVSFHASWQHARLMAKVRCLP